MRKIKVLHIITRLSLGGARDVLLRIAAHLNKENYELTLLCGPLDFSLENTNDISDNIIIIPELIRNINPIKDSKAFLKLYLFIKKGKFDIVHTHTSKAGILGRLAAKLNNVPIVFHMPHGSIFHPVYYNRFFIYILSRIEKLAALCTDRIIVGSHDEKKDFISNGIGCEDKFEVIPYYFIRDEFKDVDVDKESKRREFNILQNFMVLANIARLSPEKGHVFCLESFKKVVDKIPNVMLLLVGDGPLKKDIEKRVLELNLQRNVMLTGFRRDVAKILSIVDISLHTSLWEGTPLAIAEDMVLGKAIIATAVGGVPEIIQNGINGILVKPQDADELANCIIRLLNDKEMSIKLGSEAKRYAKENFHSKLVFEKINDLYSVFIKEKISINVYP